MLAAGIDVAAKAVVCLGRKCAVSTVSMVKILSLQQPCDLTDDALEYQVLDRRSFLQFLDLTKRSSVPHNKTIWLFRDPLA